MRYEVSVRPSYEHHQWELNQLLNELEAVKPLKRILEIGTFRGDSLRLWREVFDPELLIGVQDTEETSEGTALELGAQVAIGKSQDPAVVEVVKGLLDGLLVDFLYLDGDHHLEAVRKDWELYSPLVRGGGVVVLDDAVITSNETVEVHKFFPEVQRGHHTKLIWDGNEHHDTGFAVIWV